MPQEVVHDDAKKREFGLDQERCDGAYAERLPETAELQERLAINYLEPGIGDIHDIGEGIAAANRVIEKAAEQVHEFLADGTSVMVIPMREKGDVTRPLLSVVTQQIPPDCITVINHDSDDDAVLGVQKHSGVRVPYWKGSLDTLDWDRLLPILNLKNRPEGRGKGLSVLSGYLYQYFLAQHLGVERRWLIQHDAEIKEYGRYQALRFLVWGLLQRPEAHYAKIAKFGRTNERTMLARCLLEVLAHSPVLSGDIRRRCHDMFRCLVPHKWMQTGEFVLSWELAMDRPFASGFLEETLISMFVEDVSAQNDKTVIHVANPNSRLDEANDDGKESKMQQEISNFILEMALEAPPLDTWTIDTIEGLNHTCMARPNRFGWIPPNDHAVVAEVLPTNCLIPSIQMMVDAGLVDVDRGKALVA
jgi:hypothetical protein